MAHVGHGILLKAILVLGRTKSNQWASWHFESPCWFLLQASLLDNLMAQFTTNPKHDHLRLGIGNDNNR